MSLKFELAGNVKAASRLKILSQGADRKESMAGGLCTDPKEARPHLAIIEELSESRRAPDGSREESISSYRAPQISPNAWLSQT
jgi:hypothetical protein